MPVPVPAPAGTEMRPGAAASPAPTGTGEGGEEGGERPAPQPRGCPFGGMQHAPSRGSTSSVAAAHARGRKLSPVNPEHQLPKPSRCWVMAPEESSGVLG